MNIKSNQGLYDPSTEKGSCGVGMIVSIKGEASREVVTKGIKGLASIGHRGAIDADGKTGDGSGIMLDLPTDLLLRSLQRTSMHLSAKGRLASAMVFLPRNDLVAQHKCREMVELHLRKMNWRIMSWRQVPIDRSALGAKGERTRPEIEQIIFEIPAKLSVTEAEALLFLCRRRIEKDISKVQINDFHICSMSSRSMVYKGLFRAEQLSDFYPDLRDKKVVSSFAIFHQRYSTNTFPSWSLAQPMRVVAHNGEINTLSANLNWMLSHETRLATKSLGSNIEDIKPVIGSGLSDSAALDAVFEVLIRCDRELPEVKSLLIPEAWEQDLEMAKSHRDFYTYSYNVMEPWDGPAAICSYDGKWALAGMDRNGLRPLRYQITADGLLIAGSETGIIKSAPEDIVESGHLGPGQMIAVNLDEGKLYKDEDLKDRVAALAPFGEWRKKIRTLDKVEYSATAKDWGSMQLIQHAYDTGITSEDLETVLQSMVMEQKEVTASMGDDSPLAVLSLYQRPFHHFFRQSFAQVTNPPIDSIRERHVMSLITRIGNLGNILEEKERQMAIWQLDSPILLDEDYALLKHKLRNSIKVIDTTCAVENLTNKQSRSSWLEDTLRDICDRAEASIHAGRVNLILSDSKAGADRVAVPMILVVSAIHTRLLQKHLRSFSSLNVDTREALDSHSFAVLIGVGATTIYPRLANQFIRYRWDQKLYGDLSYRQVADNFLKSINDGLLKIMSKMGVSVISSYRGGCLFEAVGLSRALVGEFFPGLPSRISGIGLTGLAKRILSRHERAWSTSNPSHISLGGFLRLVPGGEHHAWSPAPIKLLRSACKTGLFDTYSNYLQEKSKLNPINIRDLFAFVDDPSLKIGMDQIESITEIRKRMVAPGISLGALSPEAHETIAIAMNRIGARSDSGEGGEDPQRFKPKANGDNPSSAIKQIASGRFGVTAEYLNNCSEIEIKMAQGAKPGEGGQLPGHKVSALIARLRHSTEGVTLISPPPHHDIYSIEDLAQLIYDLKAINPKAKICVKLVARNGIGAIAAGVAKAHADVILISGHCGGTGASPASSIKFAGLPWEMGLAEAHQVLSLNGLRDKVRLRVDGGLSSGRDIAIAAMLGADEFGIGTATLIAMGCLMVRQCHSNTCPVGICTQDEKLRGHFEGKAQEVINLFNFISEDLRQIMSKLGVSKISDLVGRSELILQKSSGVFDLDSLDLNALLFRAEQPSEVFANKIEDEKSLDEQILKDADAFFLRGEKMQLEYNVSNNNRALGTRLASEIINNIKQPLPEGHLTLRFRGTAGQSLGAFAVKGMRIELFGEANDYVGKGLSGGDIIIRRPRSSPLKSNENIICGNTVLYGATSGNFFAAGRAGERFAVRNSGAQAVIEGAGANACEYMTGGQVLILGSVGKNFAAGMTGGHAIVYDPDLKLANVINKETVEIVALKSAVWEGKIEDMIVQHFDATNSSYARFLLENWQDVKQHFYHIIPNEVASHYSEIMKAS